MILREADGGLTLIGQPEHARLCGIMARAWGGDGFDPVRPLEPVAQAAAEHDSGWTEWEASPQLDPTSGRPYTYQDIPIEQHLEIYRRGIGRAVDDDPYVGLLVSLHGSRLYSRFRQGQPGATEFLAEQRELQNRLIRRLEKDPERRESVAEQVLATNRDLLFGWDALSLFICHGKGWQEGLEFPTDYRGGRIAVRIAGDDAGWELTPYPFREDPVTLTVHTHRIEGARFADGEALYQALGRAQDLRIVVRIRAG